ncbi:MAG: hypothetical protein RMJ98_14080 [Myxococcales bacterium]|nr:hypothetical protein [Polyangiaceae bacterium]MDW8250420.1 hypothetical protein [Myxococcales bacterium]
MTLRPPPPTSSGVDNNLDPPPTADELAEAQALARALEGHGASSHDPLIEALRAAHDPTPLDPARHEEILVRAFLEAKPSGQVLAFLGRRWAWAGALAAAACLALALGQTFRRPAPVALVASRSTQELFPEQFPRQGGHSARMDRISGARTRELRENRFASWGVR